MKTIIEVDVTNIEVDEEYYSFDYKVTVDGVVCEEDSYESDYDNGDTPKEWKQYLKDGYAIQCVMEQFNFDSIINTK